jgi:hypothetical protein
VPAADLSDLPRALPQLGALSAEDRHHGFAVLALFSSWEDWIKRRTERIEFVNDGAVRRSSAVDFTLREELLTDPWVWWGRRGVHYVPIALLAKQPLTAFSLRDEEDRVIPLLTRRKNAAIGAAMAAALAQSIAARALRDAPASSALPEGASSVKAHQIQLPSAIEDRFLAMTFLPYRDVGVLRSMSGRPNGEVVEAREVYESFVDLLDVSSDPPRGPGQWDWERIGGDEGELWTTRATPSDWAAALVAEPAFCALAATLARNFVLCVPIEHEANVRRVLQYSYQEPITEPVLRFRRRSRTVLAAMEAVRKREEWLEGIPGSRSPDEWLAVAASAPPQEIGAWTKLQRGIGWRAKWCAFEAPAVGWGGNHHFEVVAPEGLQIRRVSVSVVEPGEDRARVRASPGARNNDRLQLYATGVPRGSQAKAEVALKPRSATVVRGAALAAIMTVAALIVTLVYLPEIQGNGDGGSLDVTAGLLLVIPGLLAVYVARGDEHAMTTSMLYGLRILAGAAGMLSVVGAGLMLIGPATGVRLVLWVLVILAAFVTAVVLAVAWRLSARGRKLEHLLPEPLREGGVPALGSRHDR